MRYHHQTVDHDASIAAGPEDDGIVRIEVAVGNVLTLDLDLHTETAVSLARDLIESAKAHGWEEP